MNPHADAPAYGLWSLVIINVAVFVPAGLLIQAALRGVRIVLAANTVVPLDGEPDLDAMIGRLNHIAIAVPDLPAASALYRDTLGALRRSAVQARSRR